MLHPRTGSLHACVRVYLSPHDQGGASDGEVGAITLFGNLMDYHGALQRYSLQLKGRYIEVR